VIIVEGLLITSMGIFNPIYATERLQRAPASHAAQVLSAWSVSSKLVQAALMVIWGILATLTSPLAAITISGVLLLATPLLLPERTHGPNPTAASPAEDGAGRHASPARRCSWTAVSRRAENVSRTRREARTRGAK
jgi:hypothetical protein